LGRRENPRAVYQIQSVIVSASHTAPRTIHAAIATTTTAVTAAAAASATFWALLPKVSAMKATSRPSRTTPLNAIVKP
jgi:hypothetical protein